MDKKGIFFSLTFGLVLYFFFSYFYLIKNRYDLNALYRSHFLMFQECIIFGIWEQSIFFLTYYNSVFPVEIISCIYIISSAWFCISYLVILYRYILLNKIEFGELPSNQYFLSISRLNSMRHLKVSWIYSIITSSLQVFPYLYLSKGKYRSILDLLYSKDEPILNIIYFIIGTIENFFYIRFTWIVIRNKFRLTIKIEVVLAFFIIVSSNIAQLYIISSESYGFILILLGFSLNIVLLISFMIRSCLSKIPDPPLVCFDSSYIYEHKLLYQHIHEFLQKVHDKQLLNSLELGIYINMYKTEKKK